MINKNKLQGCRYPRQLGVYIHIPFCRQKCYYCDFLSAPAQENVRLEYVSALCEEIRRESEKYQDYLVDTVFLGGGTPSVLEGEAVALILDTLRASLHVSKEAEITLEVNPGTADEDKIKKYLMAGMNRISIGLQSVHENELKLLGRIHTYREFEDLYYIIRKNGCNNINVDLMSALPGQTLERYDETLKIVLQLEPEHISAYSLIIEEGTVFYNRYQDGFGLPDEDTDRAMYELTNERLSQYGYDRYEISNYALKGFACRHNIKYWRREEYVGFGLGAASQIGEERFRNTEDLSDYLKSPSIAEHQILSRKEQMEEFMFLGLRMIEGVKKKEFQDQFGRSLEDTYADVLIELKRDGLLLEKPEILALTKRGLDLSNYVFSKFLLEE